MAAISILNRENFMRQKMTRKAVAIAAALLVSAPWISAAQSSDLGDWDLLTPEMQNALETAIEAASGVPELQTTPAEQSVESLSRLQKEVRRGARQHKDGFLQASPEALVLCAPTAISLCLNGRFIVTAVWESPYDGPGVHLAGAIQLTPQSGVLYFLDPTNFEIVVKVLNSNCFASPGRPWVFAAGLTNFGVGASVRDQISGFTKTYVNSLRNPFPPLQDQDTPFACF